MAKNEWKKLVKAVAPLIGAALDTPFAGLASTSIAGALAVPDASTNEAALAEAVLGANADKLLELKKADEDFRHQIAQLGFQNEADLVHLMLQDNPSTSQKEISPVWALWILAYCVTAGFFSVLGFLFYLPPTSEGFKGVLQVMLGTLGTAWITVITYYFGSSAGSDRKTIIMADQANKQSAASAPLPSLNPQAPAAPNPPPPSAPPATPFVPNKVVP